LSVVVVDEKYRILLDRELRQTVGVSKGDRLLAIPYKDGVLLLSQGETLCRFTEGLQVHRGATRGL